MQALKRVNWRIFAALLAAGLLGVIAVLPYMLDLLENQAAGNAAAPAVPLPLMVALVLLQNGALLAALILLGMLLAERIGLDMPLIRAWATGQQWPELKAILLPGAILGAAAGAILVALEALFFLRELPAEMRALFDIPLWKRLLAGLVYGGITEELLMRLFLLSLVAWLLGKWWQTPERKPTAGAFWLAIFLVAILFGLGHLPATSYVAPVTPLLVVRALVLNGVAGVAFGYLYWRHGLEAAMCGHMSAHIVMQLPGVMLLKNML